MGLKTYNEQIAVIKKANSQVAKLQSYANSMNAMIISLQSLWDDNADQGIMLNAIGDCVYEASSIYYDYNLFSVNAIRWLNNMDNLEKVATSMITGNTGKIQPYRSNYTGDKITNSRSRIHVSPEDLKYFAQQVAGYNKTLESIQAKTSGINNQIDKLILNKFAARYSLTNINRRIEKLKAHNAKVGQALNAIGEAYDATENELMKLADMMDFNAMSSGQVNGQIKKTATTTRESTTKVQDKTTGGNVESGKQSTTTSTTSVDEKIVAKLSDPTIYPKQGDSQCTLYTNIYLMTRYSLLHGGEAITIDNYQNHTGKSLWSGAGMTDNYNFTVNGETVHVQHCCQTDKYQSELGVIQMTPDQRKEYIKGILKNHPEGIGVYDHNSNTPGGMHAVLVTGYDEASGEFIVIDPATGGGEVRESQTTTHFSVKDVESIYVINSF